MADTSVWVDHLRGRDEMLAGLLDSGKIVIHPFVVGELACGNLKNRTLLLELWQNLPQAVLASHEEALSFLCNKGLTGKGIGWVDAHLLASVFLTPNTRLWTRDKRPANVAMAMDCHWHDVQ